MPKLTVEGFPTVEVESGKRLVLAIEQDAHVDVLHACGGNARCTTCRVEFIDGEPERMTVAEQQVLAAKGATRRAAVVPDRLRSRHDRPRDSAGLRAAAVPTRAARRCPRSPRRPTGRLKPLASTGCDCKARRVAIRDRELS